MKKNSASPRAAFSLPELLAPAGSPEAFHAAIAAGADAVYLGGKRFGARQYAGNFDEAGIADAVAFAHARGVKVYITVNTLIHDRELRSALEFLVRLYAMGVDAVLVQDPGLATLARKIVPGLALHASTQMTVHTAEGVRAMADLGFKRVVLARELQLKEIRKIAMETRGTGIGLEIFAHGALCFSYSGQCLLSSVIGGRSGNRGMCAQPCRKPYALVTGKPDEYGRPSGLSEVPVAGNYLLSQKDLCVCQKLPQLAHAPIVSLKIEGRMKSPEYVAIVTSVYRRALDAIASGNESISRDDIRDLMLAFNRGFTEGCLFKNRHSAVMGREQPDNRGLRIGTVRNFRKERNEALVALSENTIPATGDGLFIAGPDGTGRGLGFALNTAPHQLGDQIMLRVPGPVSPGSSVFLTSSVALAAQAKKIISGGYPALRHPLPLDCTVSIDTCGRICIRGTVITGDANRVQFQYTSNFTLTPARTNPLTPESLRKNLEKTGGTQFRLRNVEIRYDGNFFAPLSSINRMRREFLACAQAALIAASQPAGEDVSAANDRLAACCRDRSSVSEHKRGVTDPLLVVMTDTLQGVGAAAGAGCAAVSFEPEIPDLIADCRCRTADDDFRDNLREAALICNRKNVLLIMKIPTITRQRALDSLLEALPGITAGGIAACMASDAGALAAVHARCPDLPLVAGPEMNIFNHAAAKFAASFCTTVILSPELSGQEIGELVHRARGTSCNVTFGMVVEGNCEVMVSEHCVVEPASRCVPLTGAGFIGLRDGTGRVFPLRTDRNCKSHILNADETCLIDHLPAILDAGIGWLCIDARGRTPAYIDEIVRIYLAGISSAAKMTLRNGGAAPAALKERIRQIACGKITAGHYLRGLKEA